MLCLLIGKDWKGDSTEIGIEELRELNLVNCPGPVGLPEFALEVGDLEGEFRTHLSGFLVLFYATIHTEDAGESGEALGVEGVGFLSGLGDLGEDLKVREAEDRHPVMDDVLRVELRAHHVRGAFAFGEGVWELLGAAFGFCCSHAGDVKGKGQTVLGHVVVDKSGDGLCFKDIGAVLLTT
jgi:hypothetical protein